MAKEKCLPPLNMGGRRRVEATTGTTMKIQTKRIISNQRPTWTSLQICSVSAVVRRHMALAYPQKKLDQ